MARFQTSILTAVTVGAAFVILLIRGYYEHITGIILKPPGSLKEEEKSK